MAVPLFTNNAYSLLASTLASDGMTITLSSGTGSRFPTPTGGDWFLLTLIGLDSQGVENLWEIVKVTARSGDTLTIVRAQEGTTARAWVQNTRVENRLTAGGWASKSDTTHNHDTAYEAKNSNIQTHISSSANPHSTTAAQVGAMATSHAANAITGFGSSGSATSVARSDHNHDSSYQATLVSGTNIKTINGSSVMGSGGLLVGTRVRYIQLVAVPTSTALSNGTNIIGAVECPVTGTVTALRAKTTSGTCTVTFNKAGVSLGTVNATSSGATNSSPTNTAISALDALTFDVASASGSGLVLILTVQES